MAFDLNDEQKEIQAMARKFASHEIEPLAADIDRNESTPVELIKKISELGLFGLMIPEAYGGSGMDLLTTTLVLEEFATASPSLSGMLAVQMVLCPLVVETLGSEAQKQRLLSGTASGEHLLAYSQTEPAGATNTSKHLTKLTKDGDNWRLNGSKLFCTQGEADHYLVMCRTENNGEQGYGCVVVEKNSPGFSVAPYEDKLGWRGTNTGSISFDNVLIKEENIIGDILNGSMHPAANIANFIVHAASSLGCAQGMFDKTLEYVRERRIYDMPLHQMSPVSTYLVDVYNKLQAMRSLVYMAAASYDRGEAGTLGSVCKAWVCDTAFDCTNILLQLWGGSGMMHSTGINRYFRDARVKMVAEGATELHQSIIAMCSLDLMPEGYTSPVSYLG